MNDSCLNDLVDQRETREMTQRTVAIIGAGQAGFQVAASLREHSYDGRIVIIGDESHPPYQRPPLSKAYLLEATNSMRNDASS